MSVKLSSYVWDGCAASGMKLSSVVIMARLADFSSDEGLSWPSIETLSRQTGAGESTVRTAIARLEKEGWLTRTQRRKGNRNASNVYRLNIDRLKAAAGGQPPESTVTKTVGSQSEGSKLGQPPGVHPSESAGDLSVMSTTDPSTLKPVGQLPQATCPVTDYAEEIDYAVVLEAYHTMLPEMPVVLDMTNERRKKLRYLWKKYAFNVDRWQAYLRYIARHCRWMLENRPDPTTGKMWRKKNFDYLITEKCYLAVKEERANDFPAVARLDNSERDAAFVRLVAQGKTPKGRVEELAKAAAGKAGLGRLNEMVARAAWRALWCQAVRQASEEDLARVASPAHPSPLPAES